MAVDFCDYFWGEEHNGWNVLYQNMKQGLTASKDLGEFLKERASIDEAYCKSLYKLSSKTGSVIDKGTLAPILTLLKVSLEKMSTVHLHMVNKLHDLVKDVFKYNDELHRKQKLVKDEESQTEEVVRSIQATRVLVQKAKETYHQRCQDFEKQKKDGTSPKEVEKAETKLRKAHDEYKVMIDKYNNIRDDFEKKLILSCQRFQIAEESHLSQILLFVQTYSDVLHSDKNAMGQISHEFSSKFSMFTIDKLLDNFVLTKMTGLEKPVMVVFEDASSLGSGVSDQQSPEPSVDLSKQATEENTTPSSGLERSGLSSGVLSAGFLRSRREKRRDKKLRRRKEDSSDNEHNNEETKMADLLGVTGSKEDLAERDMDDSNRNEKDPESAYDDSQHKSRLGIVESSESHDDDKGGSPQLDAEGFTVRPPLPICLRKGIEDSPDSSTDSDSDGDFGIEKKIHVKIKPVVNGSNPSASVDELRATIEAMTLSPLAVNSYRKSPSESQEDGFRKQVNSVNNTVRSSSSDLLGLNFHSESGLKDGTKNHNEAVSNDTSTAFPFVSPPISGSKFRNRTGGFDSKSDASSSDSIPPALPPRSLANQSGQSSIALPRPSRKIESQLFSRGYNSPTLLNSMSRTDSLSSLEFKASGMPTSVSRGPSPLTIGMGDSIPLAVAFQEICHAYFRGTDESRVQVKITGEMMVSFPAGIVGVLVNNSSPAQLSFQVQNFKNVINVLPNKQLITSDGSLSNDDCAVYKFNMSSLTSLLQKQAAQNPSASYFNVDLLKYQVKCDKAVDFSPVHLVSYWRCEDDHTDLKIDYKYNQKAMNESCPILNLAISVPVDGVVKEMHSKPVGQWVKEEQKAVWNITDISPLAADAGKGCLRGKFECAAGPSTPATVTVHFQCEGTTLSRLEFALVGSGYRVSLVKKRFVAGKYICDADAVLQHRYGFVNS